MGAGHRGIDLAASKGDPVTSVDDGVVTHRGRIAGRGTVSITHGDGVRSTYEPVDSSLTVGDRVRRGEEIGRVGPEPGHCEPATCLHLGAKRDDTYLDPMGFFGVRRVVLLPVA
ncbi:M23 family metallopeptidase [Janibacter hoylei]|nr:M23 family metallopeptidase [Janibacter hoylei]